MKRILCTILLLLTLASLMRQPVLAGRGDPEAPVNIRITISPFQGDPGSGITVSGTGADPALKVFVTLAPQAASAAGALATVEVDPAPDGSFQTTLIVPADTPDGHYAIRAEQFSAGGNVLQYYWNGFIVGTGGTGPLLPGTGRVPAPQSTITAPWALLLVMIMIFRGIYVLIVGHQAEVQRNKP